MKRSLTIALLFVISFCGAQKEIYQKVSGLIIQNNPDLKIEGKVVVINFDRISPQLNKTLYSQLEKTANVYEVAKLKGGKKGVVCVTIVNDTQAEVVLNKEGYKKLVKIKITNLGTISVENIKNIAFDSNGDVVFKNINENEIYESVHKLITR